MPLSQFEKTRSHYTTLPFEMDYFRERIFLHGLTYEYLTTHPLKGKTIVDVGCGTSFIGRWLKTHYPKANYLGIDISQSAIKKIRALGIKIKYGNNLSLPLKSDSVDLTISEGVIQITPDPYKSFLELVRITKPKGIISLYVYDRRHVYYWVYTVLGFPVRLLYRHSPTRPLATTVLFWIFNIGYVQLANKIIFHNPDWVPVKDAYNLYHDLILTPVVFFFTKEEILDWAKKSHLEVLKMKLSINKQGLLFLFRKPRRSPLLSR